MTTGPFIFNKSKNDSILQVNGNRLTWASKSSHTQLKIVNSICRTAKNTILFEEGEAFSFQQIGVGQDDFFSLPAVYFTQKQYGPVHAVVCWEKGYKEPLYLVTNIELALEACYWYKKRFRIETFFSDQKSRGFHLNKSPLSDPQRLARFLIAACLAYIWAP